MNSFSLKRFASAFFLLFSYLLKDRGEPSVRAFGGFRPSQLRHEIFISFFLFSVFYLLFYSLILIQIMTAKLERNSSLVSSMNIKVIFHAFIVFPVKPEGL